MEDLIETIGQEVLPSQAAQIYKTLGKVLGNIIKNPDEPKFRSLKKENKLVAETLGKSQSAMALLLQIGFKDVGSMYQCPPGTDLTDMIAANELIECLAASMDGTEEAPKSADPSPAPAQTAGGYAKTAVPKAAGPLGGAKGFTRNVHDDEERKRIEQAEQLQAIRAAKASDPPVTAPPCPVTAPPVTEVPSSQPAKPTKSAFDFESKTKKQDEHKQAEQSVQDLRELQKQKYKQFEADPNARKGAEYQRPASTVNGQEKGWWDSWFGSGGSSSNSSSGNNKKPPPAPPPGGPRMKTMNDLPKPVQRGG